MTGCHFDCVGLLTTMRRLLRSLFPVILDTNRRRYSVQQPATKSACVPCDKLRINRWINRWSTRSFVPSAVYIGFLWFVPARVIQNSCLQCAGGPERRLASKATEISAPCSDQLRPALPSTLRRAVPNRPMRVRVLN